jgi:hypothetical protein
VVVETKGREQTSMECAEMVESLEDNTGRILRRYPGGTEVKRISTLIFTAPLLAFPFFFSITAADRKRNLDWIDLSSGRGSARRADFAEKLLHDFDWDQWRARQNDAELFVDKNAPAVDRLNWVIPCPILNE